MSLRKIRKGENLSGKTIYTKLYKGFYYNNPHTQGKLIHGTNMAIHTWIKDNTYGIGVDTYEDIQSASTYNSDLYCLSKKTGELESETFAESYIMPENFGVVEAIEDIDFLYDFFYVEDDSNAIYVDYTTSNPNNPEGYVVFDSDINGQNLRNYISNQIGSTKLTSIKISGNGCGSYEYLFNGCTSLKTVDIDELDITNITKSQRMFYNCSSLISIYCRKDWGKSISSSNSTYMFRGCSSLKGATAYSSLKINSSVANPNNGYFSNLGFTYESTNPSYPGETKYFGGTGNCLQLRVFIRNSIGDGQESSEHRLTKAKVFGDGQDDAMSLFEYCQSLSELNLINFDTTNINGMISMFGGCSSLTRLDLSNFDTNNVVNMESMFALCESLISLDISNFNTSNVTDFQLMFYGCSSLTDLNLSNLNTSQVTEMSAMFAFCTELEILDLLSFSVESCNSSQNMFAFCQKLQRIINVNDWARIANSEYMFYKNDSLKGVIDYDIEKISADYANPITGYFTGLMMEFTAKSESGYLVGPSYFAGEKNCEQLKDFLNNQVGTSNLLNAKIIGVAINDNTTEMFRDCSSLTNLDLSNFNTSNVTNMLGMFYNCSSLVNLNLSNFNTSNTTNMAGLFYNCSSLTNLDVSFFNTSNTTNMGNMFGDCESLPSLNLSNFDTKNVTNMASMFYGCSSLETLDLSNFDTTNVTSLFKTFENCVSLRDLNLSSFDTSKVTDMQWTFSHCTSLSSLDLSHFDGSNVTNMTYMFQYCNSLENLNLSNFNTSNVTDMYGVFSDCHALINLNISSFNTSKVERMASMFINCSSLPSLNLSNFDGSSATNTTSMFYGCSSLEDLNLSNFSAPNATAMNTMFYGCSSLKTLKISKFKADNLLEAYSMFRNCSSLKTLRIPNFEPKLLKDARFMFMGCSNLVTIVNNYDWDSGDILGDDMFTDCNLLKGAIEYNPDKVDIAYANPTTGYFTIGGLKTWEINLNGNIIDSLFFNGVEVENINYNGVLL